MYFRTWPPLTKATLAIFLEPNLTPLWTMPHQVYLTSFSGGELFVYLFSFSRCNGYFCRLVGQITAQFVEMRNILHYDIPRPGVNRKFLLWNKGEIIYAYT